MAASARETFTMALLRTQRHGLLGFPATNSYCAFAECVSAAYLRVFECVFRAKGATFTDSLGQRPRICGAPKASALKARFTSGDSPTGIFGIEEPSVEFESRFQRSIIWAISNSLGRCPQAANETAPFGATERPRIRGWFLRFSEAHGANQSPPLMPAQPKNTE
jgi:hypothetical protein